MNYRDFSTYLFGLWLLIAVFVLIPPTNPPGSAPVRAVDVAPSSYSAPAPVHLPEFMPLSAYFREPLTYEERFPEVTCPVAKAAVHEQGVGE